MRKLLVTGVAFAALSAACENGTPPGPGKVSVSKTTTSTTTTTIALPTTAAFVFSPTNPRANQAVVFNAATSFATVGRTIVSYAWVFGDGGTGTGATPTHAFSVEATYNVTLTITDSANQTATVVRAVPVVGTLSTTTTTVVPTSAVVRYVNSSALSNVPADMTLFFNLQSGNTYKVQGTYSTLNRVTGSVDGTMVGAVTPTVTGTFSGLMTANVPAGAPTPTCVGERAFSGSVGPLLAWTGGAITPGRDCPIQAPWSYYSEFRLFQSGLPPAITPAILPATTQRTAR